MGRKKKTTGQKVMELAQRNSRRDAEASKRVTKKKVGRPKKLVMPELAMTDEQREAQVKLLRYVINVQTKTYKSSKMEAAIEAIVELYNVDDNNEIKLELQRDTYGNMYVTKGEAETYPCVVSHIDTVHSIIPDSRFKVLEVDDKMLAIDLKDCTRVGVGGDDKVGVFIALSMLLDPSVTKLKAAFFKDEEHGCIGSGRADMGYLNDIAFAMQADRKGYKDVATDIMGTSLCDSSFSLALTGLLKKYGRSETSGGLTDVYQLAENGSGVSSFNASCGYYEPHTSREYIVITEVLLTLEFFLEVVADLYLDGNKWEADHSVSSYRGYSRSGYGSHGTSQRYIGERYQYGVRPSTIGAVNGNECPCCGAQTVPDPSWENWNYCYNCDDYVTK